MAPRLAPFVIGRARMPRTPGTSGADKSALARDLTTLAQAGAGEGPSEILLVRRLQVPDPGSRTPLATDVRTRLRDLRRRAVRPRAGQVPGEAEAVLFADEAQLLACLVASPGQSWWRRAAARLLGDLAGPGGLPVTLASRSESLPAVVACLDRWAATPAAERLFAAPDIARMANALAARWEVTITSADVGPAKEPLAAIGAGRPARIERPAGLGPAAALFAASRILARPGATRIAEQAKVLSGLLSFAAGTTTIVPDPTLLENGRGHAFPSVPSRAAAAHDRSESRTDVVDPGAAPNSISGQRRPRDAMPDEMTAPDLSHSAAPDPGRPPTSHRSGAKSAPRDEPPVDARPQPANEIPAVSQRPERDTPAQPAAMPAHQTGATTAVALQPRTFQTELAGVFFLWNLVRGLNLPKAAADWNMPDALGPWALIAYLGQALLPDPAARRDDPLWTLLSDLDGTPPELPVGSGMRIPDEIRVPPEWLSDAAQRLVWSHDGAHLTLQTLGGIVVLHRACRGDELHDTLGAELKSFPGPLATEGRSPRAPTPRPSVRADPALAAWLDWMTPAIRARLAEALDCTTDEAHDILIRPANVHLTPAHIDVVFTLDQADLAIRRAGLDLDPGWVPALGHILRFHYA